MPRPKKPGAGEPKRRSRNGCWPCKARKVKCGEEKPGCANCARLGETCDYSIRLTWGGRTKRTLDTPPSSRTNSPRTVSFPTTQPLSPLFPPASPGAPAHAQSRVQHARSRSDTASPSSYGLPMSHSPSLPNHRRGTSVSPYMIPVRPDVTQSPPPVLPSVSTWYDSPTNSVYIEEQAHMYNGRSLNYPADIPPATWMPYDSVPAYLTPGSPHLGDDYLSASAQFVPYQDFSRLSVYSVVSTATDSGSAYTPEPLHDCQSPMPDTSTTLYSYDRGLPDLDIPRNADNEAIDESSYPERSYWDDDSSCESMNWTDERNPSGPAFEKTAYYAKPVAIRIPKSLEPLPPLLLENKMNLIYFHHFLNHTARILVPHDCEQNPFRQILPEMAVRDENILHLLLAFSASHRARLLNHPEPANRIALWVQDVFPKLRASLDSSSTITNSTLAPALMMASLEIISPNTFEVPITWQKHLMVARQMIIARGGLQSIDRSDREAYFLCRWFVYLDVLGSLSGNRSDMPLGSLYWPSYEPDLQEDHQIDCLTGFTNRCIGLLARVAELARQCEYQRFDGDGNICEDWRPVPEVAQEAERLRKEMVDALVNPTAFDGCIHRTWENPDEASELYATNEMFHWAGLIHLYRRVLGLSATDPDVQYAVRSIVTLLREVRKAGTAEACLLFPMFTAGCDALDEEQRETIMDRLRCVEGFGIAQVHKARSLMQKVWDTGKPWESLASGEFFG